MAVRTTDQLIATMPYEIVDSEEGQPIPIAEVTFADGTLHTDVDDEEILGFIDRVNEVDRWESKPAEDEALEESFDFEGRVEHTEETAINRLRRIVARKGYGIREL